MPGGGAAGLLGETVVAGDALVSHTDGTLVLPNALGDVVIAFALQAGVSGDVIVVHVSRSRAPAAE